MQEVAEVSESTAVLYLLIGRKRCAIEEVGEAVYKALPRASARSAIFSE